MANATAGLGAHFQQGLSWWLGELRRSVPAGLRLGGNGSARQVILLWDEESARLLRRRGGTAEPVGALDLTLPTIEIVADLDRLLRGVKVKAAEVVLRLPADQGLRRTVTLPRAAEENLGQVLSYEMDRLTPWPASQVYFDWELLDRLDGGRRSQLRLTVVPRGLVDEAVANARHLGLAPRVVDLAGSDPGAPPTINLLGRHLPVQRSRGLRSLTIAVAAALLLAFAGTSATAIWERQHEIAELQRAIEAARGEAQAASALRSDIEALQAEASYVVDKKRSTASPAILLEVLSRLMPDETWLNELELRQNDLRIAGYTNDASALVPLIEGSRHFASVQFRSPVVRDHSKGAERFNIGAVVEAYLDPEP